VKVLVGYATGSGSTASIAEAIAAALQARGREVVARAMDEVSDARTYDAYVLGSAVRDQAWLPSGEDFLAAQRKTLCGKPVWLFSVGMPGALRGPWRRWASLAEADLLAGLLDHVAPIEHRLFTGVVSAERFGWFAALAFRAVGGRFGDFREWPDIERWSRSIAEALTDIEATSR
jgi:menaquinone-dependent protoporphyrinogen oxidase